MEAEVKKLERIFIILKSFASSLQLLKYFLICLFAYNIFNKDYDLLLIGLITIFLTIVDRFLFYKDSMKILKVIRNIKNEET